MDIKKMIEMTEITDLDIELLISRVNSDFIKLYKEKNIESYIETLNDMLQAAVQMEFDFVLKYFGAAPIVAADERIQFQEIFKCIGTRKSNKDWFLQLFSLFLGIASVFRLDSRGIESEFFEMKKSTS
ncbi:hypothetical protein ABE28_002950 [Peribacillus muralis]|uniref:Uncharacterized protein n=1 Tax=Peribacillus muralis TaxID=264697 RepID=A0A1B3XJ96_9BACI|nr:hypothetical protein [Peribacillus muralis]AOH53296.1 hypothetical protein ABE28_002950 [Peribacillus muralis]